MDKFGTQRSTIWILKFVCSPNKTISNIRRNSRDGQRLGSKIFDLRRKTWYTIYKGDGIHGKEIRFNRKEIR